MRVRWGREPRVVWFYGELAFRLRHWNITDDSIYAANRNAVMQSCVVSTMTGMLVMFADDDDCYTEIVTQIDEAEELRKAQGLKRMTKQRGFDMGM